MACDNSPFTTRIKATAAEVFYSPFYTVWNFIGIGNGPLSVAQQECITADAVASLGPAATQAERDQLYAQIMQDIPNVTKPIPYCQAFQKSFGFSCSQIVLGVIVSVLALVIVSSFAEGLGQGVGSRV